MNPSVNLKNRDAFGKSFARLKFVCDKIALNPNEDYTKQLSDALKVLKPNDLQNFQGYILFPMEVHLFSKSINKDKTICNLLASLKIVLTHTRVTDIAVFLRIFSVIFLQIDNKVAPGIIPNVSEEVKLNVVNCTKKLFRSANREVLEKFYEREYYPKLSLAVYACGQLAKNDGFITLRTEALDCLLTMIQLHDGAEKNYVFRELVTNVVMLMIPGIVSICVSIINGSDTQNHKILVLAVRVWGRLTGRVMRDLDNGETQPSTVFKLEPPDALNKSTCSQSQGIPRRGVKNMEELKSEVENQTRSEQWLRATGKQLMPVTKIITKLKFHPHTKVRRELAVSANLILSKAPISMSLSVSHLVDTLIILSQDQESLVAIVAQKAVSNFSKKCSTSMGKTLVEIVEESFYSLVTRLPRILNGNDESSIVRDLTLLNGYLSVLGRSHLPKVLSCSQHLNRLLNSLMQASSFDASDIALLEEMSFRNIEGELPIAERGWKKFRLCDSAKMQAKLEECCKTLRECSDLPSLVHIILDLFNIEPYNRKEYIFLINQIFSSGPSGCLIPHLEISKTVLTSYMDASIWYVPLNVGKDGTESKQVAQQNVVQVCLLSEGIAKLAVGLGPELFSPLLLRCLYQLLERAGSPIYMVACAGLKSVREIAALYGGGVGNLVAKNVDYLSHHVTLRLQNIERNPSVLSVLSVIMKNSSMQVLPSLHEIINDVLVQSCDNFQDVNANGFLQVFHTFIYCLRCWTNCGEAETLLKTHTTETKSIEEEILNYHKARTEADSFMFDGDKNENSTLGPEDFKTNDSDLDKEKEEDEQCPEYVSLTEEILKRALHFLPSKDISRQMLVLQILTGGVLLMEQWKDQLLPIVHKIWSPLEKRFNHNNNPLLIRQAFILLTTLAQCCQSFIKPRTLQHVIPSLCEILKRLASESKLKDKGHVYRMTQKFKLQLCLLRGLGQLAVNMEFREKDIYNLLITTDVYLSSLQPQLLQDACMRMYRTIASTNSDTVWLHLISICPPKTDLIPPLPYLRTFKLEESKEFVHYKKNVEELLRTL